MNKFFYSLPHRKFTFFCLALITGSIVLKLFFMTAPAMPHDDDLYYWLWFQHPLFSYPDHPPLIGYLVGLSTLIFGHNSFAITFGGFLLYLVLIILSYFLAKNLFSPPSHLAGVFLATTIAIVPYFAGIAVIMSPDTLMVFFSFLTLFAYHHAFFRNPNSLAAWLIAGTLLALAFFSKLTVFFIGTAIFFYAFASKNRRSLLSNYRFFLSFIPPTIIGITLLISDASHDWVMLKYTSLRGSQQAARTDLIPNFIYNQLKLYSPYFFVLFFFISITTIKKYYSEKNSEKRSTISEPLFFFSFLTLPLLLLGFGKRYSNDLQTWWLAFAMLSGFIMILYYLVENWHKKRVRVLSVLNFSWCFFYLSLIVFHTYFGVIDYNYKPPKDEHPLVAKYNIMLRESALFSKKFNHGINDSIDNYFPFEPFKDGRIKNYFANHLDKETIVLTGNFRQLVYAKFFNTFPNEVFSLTTHNFTPSLNPLSKSYTTDSYSLFDILFNSKSIIGQDIYFFFDFHNDGFADSNREQFEKVLSGACKELKRLKSFPSYRKTKLIATTFIFHCKNYIGEKSTTDE